MKFRFRYLICLFLFHSYETDGNIPSNAGFSSMEIIVSSDVNNIKEEALEKKNLWKC